MSDNLRIWKKVEKTNPAHTKHVNQRGGFTAVSANYQILAATEQFGPIGIGWGYIADQPIIVDTLIVVPVTLWHGNRENTFGPMMGCEEWKDKNGRIDSDAPKKATTDALTKLLSQLGFNADVFLGKFDDQKYVDQLKREFAEADKPALISDAQRDEIALMAQGAGVELLTICQAVHVDSLKDLPAAKFESIINKLKATMTANAATAREPA